MGADKLDERVKLKLSDSIEGFPWDIKHCPIEMLVPARKIKDWRIEEHDTLKQWQWIGGELNKNNIVQGRFLLTPELPYPDTVKANLEDELEQLLWFHTDARNSESQSSRTNYGGIECGVACLCPLTIRVKGMVFKTNRYYSRTKMKRPIGSVWCRLARVSLAAKPPCFRAGFALFRSRTWRFFRRAGPSLPFGRRSGRSIRGPSG